MSGRLPADLDTLEVLTNAVVSLDSMSVTVVNLVVLTVPNDSRVYLVNTLIEAIESRANLDVDDAGGRISRRIGERRHELHTHAISVVERVVLADRIELVVVRDVDNVGVRVHTTLEGSLVPPDVDLLSVE